MEAEPFTPFWSVVIPLYNKQDFIGATLDSVLNQVGEDNFEVLVVDDGSHDGGPGLVVAFSDARVKLIQQPNAGVAAARNRGIDEAKGKWIAFLDADDIWHPMALQALRQTIEHRKDFLAVAGAYVRVSSSAVDNYRFSPQIGPAVHRFIDNLPGEILKSGMPFSSSTVAIHRSVFEKLEVWFPEGESMGEDLDLWLRIAEQFGWGCTSQCIAIYRIDVSSSLMGRRVFNNLFPFLVRLEQRAKYSEMSGHVARSSIEWVADARVSLAREYIKNGQRYKALTTLIEAFMRFRSVRWWFTWLALIAPSVLHVKR